MNRNSLFGRLRSKFAVDGTAGRPESFRTQIEPLEDRKVLAVSVWVNDNWVVDEFAGGTPGVLEAGDTVFDGATTGLYGTTAFGRVTGQNVPFLAGMEKISDAINTGAIDPLANTVSILQGTYTESDIVVNKPHVILTGNGSSGVNETLIVPEVASTRAEQEFPTGSHSGVIVYASFVEVRNLHLSGGVNYDYHHGVTTLYEAQGAASGGNGGSDYASIRSGNLVVPRTRTSTVSGTVVTTTSPTGVSDAGWVDGQEMYFYNLAGGVTGLVAGQKYWINVTGANTFTVHNSPADGLSGANPINMTTGSLTALSSIVYGGITEGNGSVRPQLAFHDLVVDNAWYHGITLSGPAGMQFDEDNGDGLNSPDNEIYNSTINNVGDPSNRGENHIGILIQNVDGSRTGDPGGAPAVSPGGNVYTNIVNTAGIGIAGKVYGILSWNSDNNARNEADFSFNTVNTPVLEAYRLQDISGSEFIANFATFTNGTAIGIHTIHTEGTFLGNVIGTGVGVAAPLVGFKIENSNTANQFGNGTAGHTISNTTLYGPGTGVANSIGMLADNAYATNSDSSFLSSYGTVVTGFQKGVVSRQTVASATPNTMYLDRMQVAGNAIGFEFGSVGGGSVRIVGQLNTPDPINNLGGVTMVNGWISNLTEVYADALAAQPVPPVMTAAMTTVGGATGSLVTVNAAYTWATGQGLRINDTDTFFGHMMPGGIIADHVYFIRSASATTFSLHESQADALANLNPVTGITNTQVGPIKITELIATGRPGFNQPQYVITDPTLSKTDATTSGNLTLGAGATYAPFLGGSAASSIVTIQNFNTSQSWGPFDTTDIDHVNPWAPGFVAKARLGFWGTGTVVQDGITPALQIANTGGGANFETGGAIQFTTIPNNVTDMGYLRVIMKLGAGTTTADEILVSVVDLDGTSDLHYFPTSQMNTTSYTTFYSNILTPPIRFIEGDNVANLSAIGGWAVSGAFGSTDGIADADKISLVVDDISYVPTPRASVYNVTGTVNISGAILQPLAVGINLWTSSVGQTFTIIDNDGADAVTGTFAGLAQGATVTAGNSKYTISYTGGTGNDVVLTQIASSVSAPVVDLNSGTGGINNTVNWTSPTPVNIATSGTVTDADDTLLYKMTATLTAPEAGDVLAATGNANITVSYDSGTGVLTMTGFDTLANYQTVLNSITYNKTGAAPAGNKTITVVGTDSGGGLNSTGAVATVNTGAVTASSVTGRRIFYNQSQFDGNSAAINASDNNAIAPDKSALLPGAGQATLANITSYTRGINGIIVDLSPAAAHSGITANDFIFKVGINNTPSSWAVAPAPSALSVSMGGGVSGSDRVTITWADSAIKDKYLEVGVRVSAATNLTAGPFTVDPDGPGVGTAVAVGDVFFFGNLMGETASVTPAGSFARSAAADGGAILANGTQFSVGITNFLDINKSNSVTASADRGPIIAAGTLFLTRISIGTAGPLAPEDGGDAGIASALTSTASPTVQPTSLPAGIANRLEGLDLNSGRIAAFFQHLADQDTPGTRKILQKIDAVADELGLDHSLLDDLLVDLGLE